MKKKIMTMLLALVLAVGTAEGPLGMETVKAAVTGLQTSEGFYYKEEGFGATITGYSGNQTDLEIPDYVNGLPVLSIGRDAFWDCSRLTSVIIPEGVTTIESGAFWCCSGLASIQIPESVTEIGDSAFYGCSGLTSVSIPDSVTDIGWSVFQSCSELVSVHLPEGIQYIPSSMFAGCKKLKNVNIPDSVTEIQYYAFDDCVSLTDISFPDGIIKIDGFNRCTGLTSLSLPDSVTSIRISGCTGLTSINLPDSVTSVRLSGCTGLTSIKLPDNLTQIEEHAFYGCSGLTSIQIPENVTEIGYSAFYGCSGLTSVTIPKNVEKIVGSAFTGCGNLKKILVDEGNSSYSSYDGVLYDKEKTCLVQWPGGKVDGSIPNGITSIGFTAFNGCNGLRSVTVPKSVTSIDTHAFSQGALEEILVEEGNPNYVSINGLLCNKEKTTVLMCPGGKKHVRIPEGITTLVAYSLSACNCVSVSIPVSVINIGSSAFAKCDELNDIYYAGSKREWGKIEVNGNSLDQIEIHYQSSGPSDPDDSSGTGTGTGTGSGSMGNAGTGGSSTGSAGTGSGNGGISADKPSETSISGKIKAKSKSFTVKWKKQPSVSGYQVQYSTSKKFTKKTTKMKTVKKASATSLSVKKLKANKTYYVRVRTYKTAQGTQIVSEWSKMARVKTKK